MLQLIVNGLAMGAIYSLVAIGAVLLYNAARQLNFAQGEFVMLGAFLMYTFMVVLKLPYLVSLLLVVACMMLAGLCFERLISRPTRKRPRITFLVMTGLASIFIKNVSLNIWGAVPKPMPDIANGGMLRITENTAIVIQYLYVIAIFIILVGAIYFLLFRTIMGKKMRAVAQDRDVAALMGIKTGAVDRWTFVIYSVLGGIAGTLLAPIFFVDLEIGTMVSIFAFCACVIGGFGSLPGAILGGMILGLVEIFTARYISSEYKVAIVFAILLVILIVKPTGILGEKISTKL